MSPQYYVMKANAAMERGLELVGTAQTKFGACKLQAAHTTFLNGKHYSIPTIWTEREYDRWLNHPAGEGELVPPLDEEKRP